MLVLVFSQAFWKYNFECSNLSIKKAAGLNRTKLQSSLESPRDFVRVCWHCPFWFQDHTRSRTLVTWQTDSGPIRSDQTHAGRWTHIGHRAHTWASHIWTEPIFYTCLFSDWVVFMQHCTLSESSHWEGVCNLQLQFLTAKIVETPFINVFTWSFHSNWLSVTDGERRRNTFWKDTCTAGCRSQFWTHSI